jgi:hypothetical protein
VFRLALRINRSLSRTLAMPLCPTDCARAMRAHDNTHNISGIAKQTAMMIISSTKSFQFI